ncbi:hypothetical protein B4U80_14907 [Leptotrombidium deliense]|uniref:Serpin domain-containing protein n=1 Tax=Leptotrombidium deliense TaxID=299467 RepID=A0A443S2R5_9ACAR|nr:hypothetical protein B4U80_14907 [Leptotrombidium deliense]
MSPKKVFLKIPKFKVISEKIPTSFKSNDNFTKLTTSSSLEGFESTPNFHVSRVFLSNSFEIHETGFEYSSIMKSELRDFFFTFNCNRPFLVFLFSKEKIALLVGMIDNIPPFR